LKTSSTITAPLRSPENDSKAMSPTASTNENHYAKTIKDPLLSPQENDSKAMSPTASTNEKALESPTPSTNENHYDEKYFAWQSSLNVFGGLFKGDFLNHMISSFRRFVPVSSVLEFGSSGGNICNALAVDRKVGVEINDVARASSSSLFPRVESYKFLKDVPGEKIDFVYSWSVIEHVDSPLAILQQLLDTVTPNGIFLLVVKNDGLNSQEWSWPGPPSSRSNNHIWTWNAALLGNLMRAAGWIVCDVSSDPEP